MVIAGHTGASSADTRFAPIFSVLFILPLGLGEQPLGWTWPSLIPAKVTPKSAPVWGGFIRLSVDPGV